MTGTTRSGTGRSGTARSGTGRSGTGRQRGQADSLARWVSLGSLGLVLFMWVAIALSIWTMRETALLRATSSAHNVAAAFGEEMNGTLNTISAAMDLVAREIRDNPKGFTLDRWAKELPALARPTLYVTWVDAKGVLVSTTLKTGVPGVDFSDREHIRVQLNGSYKGLFVSEPVIGRISGRETLQVTKRIEDAAGKLLGVLVFVLSTDDLTHLHLSLDIGPRGVIALVGDDGRIRARFDGTPEGAPTAVKNPKGMTWPKILSPDGAAGILTSDAVDGVSRIFSMIRLPNNPMFVAIGLAVEDELADTRAHALRAIAFGVAASVLLGVLNLMLMRETEQRNRRELDLANEHQALDDARAELLAEQTKLAGVNRESMLSSERAETASLAKSQFLAQMSHELRTPLHAVIGFSELISHHAAPIAGADQISGYARDITRSGRHLLELINSILDLSKVESGTATLSEAVVALTDVINDSATTIRERAAEGGVGLLVRLPEPTPNIMGDPTRLRQIFINLMSNAVKFTPRGGSVAVFARLLEDGRYDVSVADTGIGMTEAEMAVALEPFGQVENSLARSFEGTGLGLPLARRMVEMHDGQLILHSVKGVGTTVEVSFPPKRVLWPDGTRDYGARDQGARDQGARDHQDGPVGPD